MSNQKIIRKLRYGMVGGGRDAFIGEVHRKAIALDGQAELVAGALSSSPEKAIASGKDLGLSDERNYPSWQAMLEGELKREAADRIDFVVIVTPNHVHFEVAKAFVAAGIHVVCDKPLVHTSKQAAELLRLAKKSDVVFAVTYNYTGYPMVRQAQHMVQSGQLGKIRKVIMEYNQGWLSTLLEAGTHKQAAWRTDPARSGVAGAVGDIGSHAENLMATVTGLEIKEMCADITAFVPGRLLDDDGSVLLRFKNGAKGVLWCSQVQAGDENDVRLRVYGEKGGLSWRQEDPNILEWKPISGPKQLLSRGQDYLCDAAKKASRIPAGHPEAFIEAFANIYLGAFEAMRAKNKKRKLGKLEGVYPTLEDGARGVKFIEMVVKSSKSKNKWIAF